MSEKNKLVGALNALKRIAEPIRAYHGTPHKFDRFDISKIGTGEGGQAYGHGLYFAEHEPVAKSYRDQLSGKSSSYARRSAEIDDAWVDAARSMFGTHSPDEIRALLKDAYKSNPPSDRQIDIVLRAANPGHLYEVNLHVPREHLLDWDAPLADQPHVLDAFGISRHAAERIGGVMPFSGKQVYNARAAFDDGPRQLSQTFLEAGIPGIQYLDQGSRGVGTGTRNFVMFDDAPIEIVRRYARGGLNSMKETSNG